MSRRQEILATLHTLPNIPPLVLEIRKMINDPDVSFRALAEKIKYDPGLTANILSMANSAYFGFSRGINSINQALVLMGTKRVFELVLASGVAPVINRPIRGYDLPSGVLWEHSVAVAVGTEELAKELRLNVPDYSFTAGLLHNIGKLALGTFVENEIELIHNMCREKKITFDAAERQVLGIDHAEVGGILLQNWNLPRHFVEIATYHHRPEDFREINLVLDLVHVADILSMMAGFGLGSDELNYRLSDVVTARLNIRGNQAEKIVANITIGVNNLKETFSSMKGE
ncbi:MAG TPA: HDOD domain-containing protein [Candidatus Marinimicrobia bacterium]|nr:HDOD domain-containing protein [Candidatus Neomarinimicrobiota bacterium]